VLKRCWCYSSVVVLVWWCSVWQSGLVNAKEQKEEGTRTRLIYDAKSTQETGTPQPQSRRRTTAGESITSIYDNNRRLFDRKRSLPHTERPRISLIGPIRYSASAYWLWTSEAAR
jgi:hypothetical protein